MKRDLKTLVQLKTICVDISPLKVCDRKEEMQKKGASDFASEEGWSMK